MKKGKVQPDWLAEVDKVQIIQGLEVNLSFVMIICPAKGQNVRCLIHVRMQHVPLVSNCSCSVWVPETPDSIIAQTDWPMPPVERPLTLLTKGQDNLTHQKLPRYFWRAHFSDFEIEGSVKTYAKRAYLNNHYVFILLSPYHHSINIPYIRHGKPRWVWRWISRTSSKISWATGNALAVWHVLIECHMWLCNMKMNNSSTYRK